MLLWQGEAASDFTGESSLRRKCMKDFSRIRKKDSGNMEYDIEQIRNELGKGMNIRKIAEKLNLIKRMLNFCFVWNFIKV